MSAHIASAWQPLLATSSLRMPCNVAWQGIHPNKEQVDDMALYLVRCWSSCLLSNSNSRSRTVGLRSPLEFEAGPLEFETGPLEFQARPLEFEARPLKFEAGPLEFEARPLEFETRPLEFEAGPLEFELGPLEFEAPPLQFETGLVELEAGPLEFKAGFEAPPAIGIRSRIVGI